MSWRSLESTLQTRRNWDQNQMITTEISICFLLLRSFKIRANESFNLIGFEIWIIQGDGVGTEAGKGNGFSPGSKPRGTIIFILI